MQKMQGQMDARERGIEQKEGERMRQALRVIRDEAVKDHKKALIADIKEINIQAKIKQENERNIKFQEARE